jgi:anti-anti-sigma factor
VKIESRIVGDVVIFDIEGEYSWEDRPHPSLGELVKVKLKDGEKKILFNLVKASITSDIGVGDILDAYVSTMNAAGQFKLVPGTQMTRGLFKMCLLDKILEIYDSVESALESFKWGT